MQVEIWSDVVCPWCYIGKRQFERALARFEHADEVEVVWRSFELDPGAPARRMERITELLASKYGMTEDQAHQANARITEVAAGLGLEYHLADSQSGNSFDAHRLVHLAATHGRGDEMKERLLRAYFTEREAIGDRSTLQRLALDVGLGPDEVEATLASDAFADEVRADEQRAAALGISGVPFFVVDGTFGVSGAQSPEVLVSALEQAWERSRPLAMVTPPEAGPSEGSCEGGACAV